MTRTLTAGETVQTPFGKGVVRELRGGSRALVEVQGRALVVPLAVLAPVESGSRRRPRPPERPVPSRAEAAAGACDEIDLHGLTVDEALVRVEVALDRALLADRGQLRVVHGRSGGRIRAALHRRLRAISAVRGFRLDPAMPA